MIPLPSLECKDLLIHSYENDFHKINYEEQCKLLKILVIYIIILLLFGVSRAFEVFSESCNINFEPYSEKCKNIVKKTRLTYLPNASSEVALIS